MRKRIIGSGTPTASPPDEDWLDAEQFAGVEITSETPEHPIEAALLPGATSGWQAAEPGRQTIRLLFARPQRLRRIWLRFEEARVERTQEHVLRWSPDGGQSFSEVVRQQWNFSPQGAMSQVQDQHVDLAAVTMLELSIVPDISNGSAVASLAQLRLA
jgi:hypothetical protein